ncbi:hypothetical protein TWF694_008017 [Orbilia ellipsospora]|uniref:Uncharacterized protein n=1 Tax=Orbilia ellipsospora TaxID=2528407 RepID=A0AAV9XI69_9PEZI
MDLKVMSLSSKDKRDSKHSTRESSRDNQAQDDRIIARGNRDSERLETILHQLDEDEQYIYMTCPGQYCSCSTFAKHNLGHCPQICNCPLLRYESQAKHGRTVKALTTPPLTPPLLYNHQESIARGPSIQVVQAAKDSPPGGSSGYSHIFSRLNDTLLMDISTCPAAQCGCASKLHEQGRHCGECVCIAKIYEWASMKGEHEGISVIDALVSGAVSKDDYKFPEGITWEQAAANEHLPRRSISPAEQGTNSIFPPMHPSVYRPNNGKGNSKSRLIIQVNATFPLASFDRPGGNPRWSLREIVNSRRATAPESRTVEYAVKYVFSNGEPACQDVVWHDFDDLNFPWGIRLLRIFHRRYFAKPKDRRVDDRNLVEWKGERSEWFNGTDLFKKELEKKAEYQALQEAQEAQAQRTPKATLTSAQMSTSKAPGEDTDIGSAKNMSHTSMAVECPTSSDSDMWETFRKANRRFTGFVNLNHGDEDRGRGSKKPGQRSNNIYMSGGTMSDPMEIISSSTESDTTKKTLQLEDDERIAWRARMKKATENVRQAAIGTKAANNRRRVFVSEQENGQSFHTPDFVSQVEGYKPKLTLKTNFSKGTVGESGKLGMIGEEDKDNDRDDADDEREADDLDQFASKRSRDSAGSNRGDLKRARFFDKERLEMGSNIDDASRASADGTVNPQDTKEEKSLPEEPADSIEIMNENDEPGNMEGRKRWNV